MGTKVKYTWLNFFMLSTAIVFRYRNIFEKKLDSVNDDENAEEDDEDEEMYEDTAISSNNSKKKTTVNGDSEMTQFSPESVANMLSRSFGYKSSNETES